ncbi:MAG: polymerase protein [Candidatus Moranbacteria bacterium GW2011_GWF2_35_39]|nr:MAG: polymerase protein [Candidatus Moranbacteria bacterium GW2011_GWF2_35_39]
MKLKSKYVADFEATGEEQYKIDGSTHVWAVGVIDIETEETVLISNDIADFMNWLSKDNHNHKNKEVFFHNLKYDGDFIVKFLLENGFKHSRERALYSNEFSTLISDTGTWYEIKICFHALKTRKVEVKIHDSYKLLPFSEEKIAKAFKLTVSKGEIDYDRYRPVGYQLQEYEVDYLKTDLLIMAQALKVQMNKGLTKMTIGSNALADYKQRISKDKFKYLFPVLDNIIDADLRHAYRGGHTYLQPFYANKILENVHSYDKNSMHPSQMKNMPMPYGIPVYYEGEYKNDPDYPLFIQSIEIDCKVKKGYLPTIQPRNAFRFATTEFLEDTKGEPIQLFVTSIDLMLILEHYDIHYIQYLEGFKFRSHIGLFDEYIDYWYHIKETNTGPLREIAKLMLNNLYGKFGTNPIRARKEPIYDKTKGAVYVNLPAEEGDAVYIPMACFITAYSRYDLISTAQKFYKNVVYMDTDSIKFYGISREVIEAQIEVHDTKIGAWKYEGTAKMFKALRPKTYAYIDENDELDVKCAGLPKKAKKDITFDTFQYGFVSKEKLEIKRVKGGTILLKTKFEIKKQVDNKHIDTEYFEDEDIDIFNQL